MVAKTAFQQGLLYEQARGFAQALETSQVAAVDQMLGAWTDSYWGIRQEMDAFLLKVAQAQAAGLPTSPAWAYQQARLKNLLDTTKAQIARYAADASLVTEKAQWAAIQASLKNAQKLTATALAEQLPGYVADLATVNPKVLEAGVGFLADGSVLRNHLALTLPGEAAEKVQSALLHGLATGKSQAWMLRKATEGLALSHTRATTILRTESLRAYRHASRAQYLANQDVMGTWVWHANLDARTCVACALMDGTEHPLDATLDGHPRCRCAMVPRTKTWDEILGKPTGLPDTRPPIRSGKAWFQSQTPAVQRAMMGPAKFDAWTKGTISLDDLVARTYSPNWGTMRTERSLKAILEGRNANYFDAPGVPKVAAPKPPPLPEAHMAQGYADRYDLPYLQEWLETPGNSPQALANVQAAINLKVAQTGRIGPSMPKPDLDKVKAAVAKLENAVLTKGYPSKGYSQTKAIYKAQAHGDVGSQVGVVKSLTWEQKITAQRILSEHDAALPALARKAQKAKALDDAHGEALAIQAQKMADEAAEKMDQELALLDASAGDHAKWTLGLDLKALDLEDALKAAGDDPLKVATVKARQNALDAHNETYFTAQQSIQANQWTKTTWTSKTSTLEVDEWGWGTITDSAVTINLRLAPHHVQKFLTGQANHTWAQVLTPDPSKVTLYKAALLDDDGLVDSAKFKSIKDDVDNFPGGFTPQALTDWKEALDQAWHTMKWKAEDSYVAKIKGFLDDGTMTPQSIRILVDDPDAKPLSKANAVKAIQEWQAEQIGKASIPVPKPAIQVNKIHWDKVSDAQVDKLLAKVKAGDQSLDDLYAAFQKSKNAGPKANYAKAILTLEGKADNLPTPGLAYSQKAYDAIEDGVNDDTLLLAQVITKAKNGDAAAKAWIKDQVADGKLGPNWATQAGLDPDNLPTFKALDDLPQPVVTTPAPNAWVTKPPFDVKDLKDTGKVLGTHGARVYEAPDGTRWLFKPPKDPKDGFLATLDEAASRFQAQAGLKAPDTFVVTLGGRRGSIQRMFPAKDGFPSGFNPSALTKPDLDAVQRENVLDWFLSNHDGHVDQFLRLEDGTMVGIDKGQAFRWFGQDRLDWDFHPNQAYGAPPPVYNALWREFAEGRGPDLDPPGQGAMWDQIKAIQAIPDDQVRALFREYAEQAASRGLLAKRQSFPGLKSGSIPENDVEAFLDALVDRKNRLGQDFTDLYEKAAKARAKALPGWKPVAPKVTPGKAKWVGKDKPEMPPAPEAPQAATAALFDNFLQEAKDRYAAFAPGKSLENSNNWARFRRIVDDLDENAVDELVSRSYLTDAQAAQAKALIAKAKAERAALEAAYKRAQAAHTKAVQAYKNDLGDWKEANGIQDLTQGMDNAVLRHKGDQTGLTWAQGKWKGTRYTPAQRKWLKDYTGSYYDSLNAHLRSTLGKPTDMTDAMKHIDEALNAQPIPEDVILHRGVGAARHGTHHYELNGIKFTEKDDLTKIIGSVQVDHGYMSTSVGNSAAFSGHPIQLKIRAPQGTPANLVTSISNYGTAEREVILGRGQQFYVHNAYKTNGKWFLEVEVVPEGFNPVNATPTPSATPWDH